MLSLRDQLALAETESKEAEEKVLDVDSQLKKSRAKNQSAIAMIIIIAFVACIALIFMLVGYSVLFGMECDKDGCAIPAWKEPSTFLLTIISSVMLPIVTLVLGYYFGKEKEKE